MWLIFLLLAGSIAAADPTWVEALGGTRTMDASGAVIELDLKDTWATDADLIAAGSMTRVGKLNLAGTKITDAGLENLRRLRNVIGLDCTFAEYLTEDGIANLKDWSKLERLNLRGTKVTSKVFDHLARHTSLRWLDLAHTQIDDEGFDQLAGLTRLEHLAIGGNRISGQALDALAALPALVSLDAGGIQRVDSGLWGLALTEANVARLAALKNLRVLLLNGATISDRGTDRPGHPDAERTQMREIVGLAALTNLEVLDLSRTPVSARELEAFRALPNLRDLRLGYARNVDDGAVAALLAMPQLKLLYLGGSKVTADGIARLRARGIQVR